MKKKQSWGQQYTSTGGKKTGAVRATKAKSPVTDQEVYITPQQFVKLPLSEAITQVIYDVKRLTDAGMNINMHTWWEPGSTNKEPCSVCLGGAALCSFAVEKVNGYTATQYADKVLNISLPCRDKILFTFNGLRMGNVIGAFRQWYSSGTHGNTMRISALNNSYSWVGRINRAKLKSLLIWMEHVSKELAKLGY